jgi:uncharacterized membrane protein YtjA (UPF0391 family)
MGRKSVHFDGFFARNLRSDAAFIIRQAAQSAATHARERTMLGWVVTFLVVALIAGLLGFGGIAGASIEIAKIIFFIAIVLFLVSAVIGLMRGRSSSLEWGEHAVVRLLILRSREAASRRMKAPESVASWFETR